MRIRIVLSGPGGELDARVVETVDGDSIFAVSKVIRNEISDWNLAPGDTIRIVELEPR